MFALTDSDADSDAKATLTKLSQQLSRATGLPVELLSQLESTNQTLLDGAPQLPLHPHSPCALMALSQTAGRGRRGRTWTVPPPLPPSKSSLRGTSSAPNDSHRSMNCYSHFAANPHPAFLASLGIRSTLSIDALTRLPLHIGVAVAQTLNSWGCKAQLKWPNDIVIDTPIGSAKLGGILVETRSLGRGEHAIVLGMGLNWHSAPALADKVTACVKSHAAVLPNPTEASAALIGAMALAWQRCVEHAPCDFAPYDALYGREITALDTVSNAQQGVAIGINAAGHLGLRLGNGHTQWLHSGEVSIRTRVRTYV